MRIAPFGQYPHQSTTGPNVDVIQEIELGDNYQVDRIGLWGDPGLSFTLNGTAMTLDRTGIFEASMIVTSLIIAANKDFVVDYHYSSTNVAN